jgi:CRP-like cAMP-binding protein
MFATWIEVVKGIQFKQEVLFRMAVDLFDHLHLFDDLSVEQRELLRPLFDSCECHAGTVLFEQGEPATFLYLVIAGEVAIRFKPEDGQTITIGRVHDGDLVGWSAVIGRRLYTSTAICSEHTSLLRVRGADLQGLREQYPETGIMVIERLATVVAPRVQSSHLQVVAMLEYGLSNGS